MPILLAWANGRLCPQKDAKGNVESEVTGLEGEPRQPQPACVHGEDRAGRPLYARRSATASTNADVTVPIKTPAKTSKGKWTPR
jgi:hypothetical protein